MALTSTEQTAVWFQKPEMHLKSTLATQGSLQASLLFRKAEPGCTKILAPVALGTLSSLFTVIAMLRCSLQPSQKCDLPKVMQIDRGRGGKQSWMYEVLMKTFEIRPGARFLVLFLAQDKNPNAWRLDCALTT